MDGAVNIEKMTVQLRVRSAMQAFDLGAQMLRAWAFQIYVPFIMVMVLIYVALMVAFWQNPWVIFWTLLFLKPLWDRIPLYVVSRKLFGEETSILKTLASWLSFSKPGLLMTLTWLRLSPARSLMLPVVALEGQRGKARRRRINIILHSLRPQMLGLMWLCLLVEMLILLLSFMFLPGILLDWKLLQIYVWNNDLRTLHYTLLCWFLSFLIIEPFYVAAGFSLYINRRTNLEAWDLELLFRRIAARAVGKGRAAVFVVLCAGLVFQGMSVESYAQQADESEVEIVADWEREPQVAPDLVNEILEQPPFVEEVVEKKWKLKKQYQSDPNKQTNQAGNDWDWSGLQGWMSLLTKVFLIFLAVGALSAIAFMLYRVRSGHGWQFWRSRKHALPEEVLPEFMAGVHQEMAHEERVVARADKLWQEGHTRAAMSLLYRGGLLQLITSGQVQVQRFHTEQECQHQIEQQIGGHLASFFKHLTNLWIYTAYAHQPPTSQAFSELCSQWQQHLERAA